MPDEDSMGLLEKIKEFPSEHGFAPPFEFSRGPLFLFSRPHPVVKRPCLIDEFSRIGAVVLGQCCTDRNPIPRREKKRPEAPSAAKL